MLRDTANAPCLSVVSLWEIALKVRLGKLRADVQRIVDVLSEQGFALLAIQPIHLVIMTTFPDHHRDPFDHLLAAQAIAEGAILLTTDRRLPLYPVRCLDCAK